MKASGGGGEPSACLDIIKLPHSVEMNAQWYLIKSHSEQYYIMLQLRNILSDEKLNATDRKKTNILSEDIGRFLSTGTDLADKDLWKCKPIHTIWDIRSNGPKIKIKNSSIPSIKTCIKWLFGDLGHHELLAYISTLQWHWSRVVFLARQKKKNLTSISIWFCFGLCRLLR